MTENIELKESSKVLQLKKHKEKHGQNSTYSSYKGKLIYEVDKCRASNHKCMLKNLWMEEPRAPSTDCY